MTSTAPSQPPPDESMDEHVEDESVKSDEGQAIPGIEPYEISFFGADYPIDALYKRLKSGDDAEKGDIYIPDFQRGYVWSKRQADRFIESLLLGLPVPGIFLSTDPVTSKRLVIDGGQRLRTIQLFIEGELNEREFVLGKGVWKDFEGKGYRDLLPKDRRRFDDTIIHATIFRQDKPANDNRSLLYIFERLNTGGTPAQAHEIRRSLWGGSLNEMIKLLDKNKNWRNIYGNQSKRLKDQEMILRFFALYADGPRYGSTKAEGTMKGFLDSYMVRNRNMAVKKTRGLRLLFEEVISLVNETLSREAFRRGGSLNAAIFDSVMVALAHRRKDGGLPDPEEFQNGYYNLLKNQQFQDAIYSGTSQSQNVRERLRLAREAFMKQHSQ